MRVLVFNCGSSSLKFELLRLQADGARRQLARGRFEEIGRRTQVQLCAGTEPMQRPVAATDHAAAALYALDWLQGLADPAPPDVIVHRIVHGGEQVSAAVRVDAGVIAALEQASQFAPLHNPPALATLHAVSARLPAVPAVVVPDTAFHHTLPDQARLYALPQDLATRLGIRRFGFHGIGHAWMMQRYAAVSATPVTQLRLITLQLGAGCSAAAIDGGRSVDTSMGLTPLEGLMMASRCGDLDPAIVGFLARGAGLSGAQVDELLNHRSGLLGVSGRSGDMRELQAHAAHDARSALAVRMFCYRVRKYIGAYLAALGGADAIIFGGGIGEHAAEVRSRICAGLESLGIVLDEAANRAASGHEACISAPQSRVRVQVIPLDEELYMARAAVALIQPQGAS